MNPMRDGSEQALIQAIEANPDDVDAYYVYGDYLQASGDPRGELVALHAAHERSPDDKQLTARADKYLNQHAEVLLGELTTFGKGLKLVWQCGFIRDAIVDLPPRQQLIAVGKLVRHPAATFLQSLAVGSCDVGELVDLLVAEARPRTLASVRVRGGLSEDALGRLRAVFPRIDAAHDVQWRAIATAVGEQRRGDVKYDAAKLPALDPIAVMPAGIDTAKLLIALRLELDKNKPLGVVAAMRRTFTAASLDRFAVALGDQFTAGGETTAMRWGFLAMGGLGGDGAARWIGRGLVAWSHQRAEQGVHLLAAIGTAGAHWEIYLLASDPTTTETRRRNTQQILDQLASTRSLSSAQFVDRIVPTQLSARGRDAVIKRFHDAMIDGRRYVARDFIRYVMTHPAVGPLAERLVWACYRRSEIATTFRSTSERAVDLDGNQVDLEGAAIGVVHPAEIADSKQRARLCNEWREAFDALEIEPLFPQLDRAVHTLRDNERGHSLTRFKLRVVGFDQLQRVLQYQRGWQPRLIHTEWGTDGWAREFPRDNATALAEIDNGAIGGVSVTRSRGPITLDKLHPVTVSELLDDLEVATTRPAAPAAPKTTADDVDVAKGMRVRIDRGPGRGKVGVVFWVGTKDGKARVGLRGDDDETYWADRSAVVASEDGDAAPAAAADQASDDGEPLAFAKGSRVAWKKGKHSGLGTVFWIGKNKFGDGMRVGVRDDETRETVWADAADCTPTEK